MKITIGYVAEQAGVSKTTVSRILNGNYAHTSEETRARVLHVIRELDYQPNALAKGLKSLKTNVVGMVLSNLKNPFWSTVLEGVEDACRKSGYNLMICNSNEDPAAEEQFVREFRNRQVDGIVINPTARNMDLYRKLLQEKYPMVVVNRRIPGLQANNVIVDNFAGASLAVCHLIRQGRERIAVCAYENPYVSTWKERVEGYRAALSSVGWEPERYRLVACPESGGKVKKAVLDYLRANPDTDAIFSTNNMITLEVYEAIHEAGLRIPEDIAVVGYDETVWSKHLAPPLTTIEQPGYELGQQAAHLLIKTIGAKRKPRPKTVLLEPRLIIRESCRTAGTPGTSAR